MLLSAESSAVIFSSFVGSFLFPCLTALTKASSRATNRFERSGLIKPSFATRSCKILQHTIHQGKIAGKLKFDLFVNVRKKAGVVNIAQFVRERLLDYFS